LLGIVVVLGLLFYGGGGWYFADQLRADGLRVAPHQAEYRSSVSELGADSITLTQGDPADGELFEPGLFGLFWEGGYGTVEEVIDQSESDITRGYRLVEGTAPIPGTPIDVDPWVYPDQGGPDLGLSLTTVEYQSPLGPMDAVFVPGSSSTWVIVVHGKNATPREAYRIAKPLSGAGYPVLAITHRNDRDQPGDPSGFHRFGVTEWVDLEGAVEYALASGAEDVILVGLSTGGAIVLSFLEHSQLAGKASALILDAPNIDFGTAVTYNAARRKLPLIGLPVPASLAWNAKTIASIRFGVDWGAIDYVARADQLQVPVLALHGVEDPSVPIEVSRQLAAARPDLVRLVEFEGAKHVQSWNRDRERYEREVLDFLGGI
jgi:alpha-beta hydrolase superfamily lysophospholipase